MTKPRPNRLGMYADLIPVLDAALASGGGSYALLSHGQAVHWRQRAYTFRKLYAETINANSKYDQLTLPRIEENSSVVVMRLRNPMGNFTPASNIVPILDAGLDDDLLSVAEEFAKKLGG